MRSCLSLHLLMMSRQTQAPSHESLRRADRSCGHESWTHGAAESTGFRKDLASFCNPLKTRFLA